MQQQKQFLNLTMQHLSKWGGGREVWGIWEFREVIVPGDARGFPDNASDRVAAVRSMGFARGAARRRFAGTFGAPSPVSGVERGTEVVLGTGRGTVRRQRLGQAQRAARPWRWLGAVDAWVAASCREHESQPARQAQQ